MRLSRPDVTCALLGPEVSMCKATLTSAFDLPHGVVKRRATPSRQQRPHARRSPE